MEDKEFYELLAKKEAFENDLKNVFVKHKVQLKNDVDMWHGGSCDIIKIFIDGEHWISENFDEVLAEIEVIK